MNPMAGLKKCMKDHGIRARDLARMLGVTEGAVSQVLNSTNPRWKTLSRMAEVMGVTLRVEVV